MLHAAGQLVWIVMLEALEADHIDEVLGPLARLGRFDPGAFEAEEDILEHSAPGQQGRLLEDHGAVRSGFGDLDAIDDNPSAACRDEPIHHR